MSIAIKKKFLIIIPVFNEEKYILDVIAEVKKYIDNRLMDILIINDGSTDKTSEILCNLKDINLIHHKYNQGYGKSLIDGFEYAIKNQYRYVITMDCDKQHQPLAIKNFVKEIKKRDWDIISGSRYLNIAPEKMKTIPQDRFKINRKITEKLNSITNYNLTDAFCGFKAYKVSALKKLRLTEHGYGMPVQLWLQANKNNLKIKEIPVELIYFDYTRNFMNRFKSDKARYRYYLKIISREVSDEHPCNRGTS